MSWRRSNIHLMHFWQKVELILSYSFLTYVRHRSEFRLEAYFLRLQVFKEYENLQTQDPQLKSLSEDLCSWLLWPEKSIDLGQVYSIKVLQTINTFKYHVFAPMGRFQLESIYLYFPPSSQLLYLCFCPVGLSLL